MGAIVLIEGVGCDEVKPWAASKSCAPESRAPEAVVFCAGRILSLRGRIAAIKHVLLKHRALSEKAFGVKLQ